MRKVGRGALFVAIAIVAGLIASFSAAGAWPWDSGDQEVQLSGLVQCSGFELSPAGRVSTAPKPNPVEWLTIRGVTDPLMPGHTAIRAYKAKVKVGWKVEYTLKCKNSKKIDGSFTVGKRAVGSSARQTRHICQPSGLAPCSVPELGACGLAIVQGAVDLPADLADWVLDQVESNIPIPGVPSKLGNGKDCFDAAWTIIRGRTPEPMYRTEPEPAPAVAAPAETIPESTAPKPMDTLPTVPDVPPAPSVDPEPSPSATPAAQKPVIAPVPVPVPVSPPTPVPAPPAASNTYRVQQGTHGANTFRNPQNASGQGPRVGAMQWIDVYCKAKPPSTIASASPDGYWYKIASPPWNGAYYAVANTFWNGDIPGQMPYTHNTDFSIPDC